MKKRALRRRYGHSDADIHAAVDAARRALRTAETKATRAFAASKEGALKFLGDTDV